MENYEIAIKNFFHPRSETFCGEDKERKKEGSNFPLINLNQKLVIIAKKLTS